MVGQKIEVEYWKHVNDFWMTIVMPRAKEISAVWITALSPLKRVSKSTMNSTLLQINQIKLIGTRFWRWSALQQNFSVPAALRLVLPFKDREKIFLVFQNSILLDGRILNYFLQLPQMLLPFHDKAVRH